MKHDSSAIQFPHQPIRMALGLIIIFIALAFPMTFSVGGNTAATFNWEKTSDARSGAAPEAKSDSAIGTEAAIVNQRQDFSHQDVSPLASSGTTSLFTITGSGAGTSNGDYVSDGAALDT